MLNGSSRRGRAERLCTCMYTVSHTQYVKTAVILSQGYKYLSRSRALKLSKEGNMEVGGGREDRRRLNEKLESKRKVK